MGVQCDWCGQVFMDTGDDLAAYNAHEPVCESKRQQEKARAQEAAAADKKDADNKAKNDAKEAAPASSSGGSSAPSAPAGPGLLGQLWRMNRNSEAKALEDMKTFALWFLAVVAWPFDINEETRLRLYGPRVGRLSTKHRRIMLGVLVAIPIGLALIRIVVGFFK